MVKIFFCIAIFIAGCSKLAGQSWKLFSDTAVSFYNAKKFNDALGYYEKASAELLKDSAETNTLARNYNMQASIYTDMGKFDVAEPLFREAGKIWEKLFGKDHPNYAIMLHNLGRMFHLMNKTDKAEPLYLEAKQIREKQGKDHPDYASTCNNLAILYSNTNRKEQAELLLLEMLDVQKNKVGINHLNYARSCSQLASLYWQMAKYSKAEPLYLEAKRVRGNASPQARGDYATTCDDLGNLYTVLGDYEKAEPFYIEARHIRDSLFGKKSPPYGATCSHYAILYVRLGKYKNAEPLFVEAKNIDSATFGKKSPNYISSCSNLAGLYSDIGKYDKSLALYLESQQIIRDNYGTDNDEYVSVCSSLGSIYERIGQYDKSELSFMEAGKLIETTSGNTSPDYANYCNNLGDLYRLQGKYDKAEPLIKMAREIWKNTFGTEHRLYAFACDNLAGLYEETGQLARSEELYMESRLIWKNKPNKEDMDYAKNCNGLGALYKEMGRYPSAILLYTEAKELTEKILGNKHPEYASCCNNLGSLYSTLGEYEIAEQFHLEAKQIREVSLGKESMIYASSTNNLGALYHEMGIYDKAEALFLEAKQIREASLGKQHPLYAASCSNLGAVYDMTGQYDKAEPLYIEARQVWGKNPGKDHPDYSIGCNNLALLYTNLKKYEKAEPLYLESIKVIENALGNEHPDYAANCENLAIMYINMGQYDKATPLLLKSNQIGEKIFGKDHPEYSMSCRNLATLYWNLNDNKKAYEFYTKAIAIQYGAIKKVFEFTSENEKRYYLRKMDALKKYLLSFNMVNHDHSQQGAIYDLSLFSRNLILSSSQKIRQIIYNSSDTAMKSKYDSWIDIREQLAFWYTKPAAERAIRAKTLEGRADSLEKELTRLSGDFSKQQHDVNWKDIQQSLKDGEAAIEFADFQFNNGKQWTDSIYYIALVLRKDMPEPKLVKLFEKKELEAVFRATKKTKDSLTINFRYAKDNSLYKLIWQPLEKHLSGINRIYFAPSGVLHEIPLASLSKNENERISDIYRLTQLATTASVAFPAIDYFNSGKLSLYGGIFYSGDSSALKDAAVQYKMKDVAIRSLPEDIPKGDSLPYLLQTKTEVENIQKMALTKNIQTLLSIGWEATEESVKSLNGQNSPTVLHIATHGFFFPDPKTKHSRSDASERNPFRQSDNPLFRSMLTMAGADYAWRNNPIKGIQDGILTAYEIASTYLPETKLAVLSACKTGLGDIQGSEGVYGLQRAFKIAGVKNLLMSLWDVPDAETAEFMTEFYKKMFDGQSIDDAFYNAQNLMKNKYRNNPYKWAAWILVK